MIKPRLRYNTVVGQWECGIDSDSWIKWGDGYSPETAYQDWLRWKDTEYNTPKIFSYIKFFIYSAVLIIWNMTIGALFWGMLVVICQGGFKGNELFMASLCCISLFAVFCNMSMQCKERIINYWSSL